jgi:mannose/fructose/N-acetylgalactosamine-specific phosphotransferase system component IIB
MNNLGRYLKRFQIIIGDKAEEKRVIQSALKIVLNLNISLEQIRIEKGVAVLNLSPLERGELFMHKKDVLELVKQKGLNIMELR